MLSLIVLGRVLDLVMTGLLIWLAFWMTGKGQKDKEKASHANGYDEGFKAGVKKQIKFQEEIILEAESLYGSSNERSTPDFEGAAAFICTALGPEEYKAEEAERFLQHSTAEREAIRRCKKKEEN